MLGLYGGADAGIPLEIVEQMKAALADGSAGGAALAVRRLSAGAARLPCRLPAELREAAADDGWKRCLDWLRAHGVA